jgi:hypothetical protein
MNVEHWWNDNWQGKAELLGESMSHCSFVRFKSFMDCLEIEALP